MTPRERRSATAEPDVTEGSWPGLDRAAQDAFRDVARSGSGLRFLSELEEELHGARGIPCPLGPPAVVGPEFGAAIARFLASYHRAIETIVRERGNRADLRLVLRTPEPLRVDLDANGEPGGDRIHVCRIDLLPDADGGLNVIETNANCPGGLISSGIANRRWRQHLSGIELDFPTRLDLPIPLEHEHPNWMARWFLDVAHAETGTYPTFVALFREDGGNRLELPDFLEQLHGEGVEAIEADPRELSLSAGGTPVLRGREVRHAYLKLGIREMTRMRSDLDALVTALQERRLFVPNGLRGRVIGDNKLCLAVLSDPRFEHLFDPHDLNVIRGHIPWSRNIAHCSEPEMRDIERDRERFVLKRPLDTKGRGVVVGREVSEASEWERALLTATREGWLVQEFCEAAEIASDFDDARPRRHDVSVGAINGKMVSVFLRSSDEFRFNLARSGRLHPIFVMLP